jgi:hypothetical protein
MPVPSRGNKTRRLRIVQLIYSGSPSSFSSGSVNTHYLGNNHTHFCLPTSAFGKAPLHLTRLPLIHRYCSLLLLWSSSSTTRKTQLEANQWVMVVLATHMHAQYLPQSDASSTSAPLTRLQALHLVRCTQTTTASPRLPSRRISARAETSTTPLTTLHYLPFI